MNETRLLNHIHQNADMGRDSLRHILDMSKSADFTKAIHAQLEQYDDVYDTSEEMLASRGAEGEDARMMSKLMADFTSRVKSMTEPTDSRLAEMVIEGSTMGITKLTKQINDYDGKDKDVLDFAKDLIKREQDNIEKIKVFL